MDGKGLRVDCTHRREFYCDEWIPRGGESDVEATGIQPVDMYSWEWFVLQLVDEVSPDVVRMNVEIARVVGFDGSGEKREMFEDVSER